MAFTNKILLINLLLICSVTSIGQKKKNLPVSEVLKLANDQFTGYIAAIPDSTKYPRSIKADGTINVVDRKDWTSGFFAGNLWQMYKFTNKQKWKEAAQEWTETLEEEKKDGTTHDLGFMLYNSFGKGYALTKNKDYKAILIEGAYTLSKRFSPVVGSIRSWDGPPWNYPVIVDNLMNLEYLLWAFKQTKDSSFYKIATTHANTDLKNRFRADNSTFHVIDYNPTTGKIIKKQTHQGYADNSCWARGQAWALYGLTTLYRDTRNKNYLNAALKAADYFIKQINKSPDKIPFWDFNDPAIPKTEKDASAAAIVASGLLELSSMSGGKRSVYYNTAVDILNSLCSDKYLAKRGTNNFFLLKHCVGNKPAKSEIDVPLVYADYYFLEALWRYSNYSSFIKNK
jgi:unsaturated chondroitin disaccharide hydrolase